MRADFAQDENKVRRDKSYLYEQFMPTEGTDVKVYAVGQEYAHAEARKSPVVDGVVARSSDGKEVRYPIILSRKQKRIAHQVSANRSRPLRPLRPASLDSKGAPNTNRWCKRSSRRCAASTCLCVATRAMCAT